MSPVEEKADDRTCKSIDSTIDDEKHAGLRKIIDHMFKLGYTVWTLFLLTVQILYNVQIMNLKRGHVELFSHIRLQAGLVPEIGLEYEGTEDQLWLRHPPLTCHPSEYCDKKSQ